MMPGRCDKSTPPKTSTRLGSIPLISICICTYRRPVLLAKLLDMLAKQDSRGLFRVSFVIVDNDAEQSARSTVESWARRRSVSVTYVVEPRQNIAIARNVSVATSTGDLVAFIDDDEEPSDNWLYTLYQTLLEYDGDGVLGPVLPKFEEGAPAWAVKAQLFQRPSFKTGTVIHWRITGTGNVLLRREVLQELDGPFNSQLGAGGEDTDLFRRATARGRRFVWSAEAACHEHVPLERTRVSFQLRRALLRGKIAARGHRTSWSGIMKSAIAVPLYAASLPFCLVIGTHVFVSYLVRSFDHLGKLLATCGIDLVGDQYITG
jgi:succinoglycan biosynthesis protein ExoM